RRRRRAPGRARERGRRRRLVLPVGAGPPGVLLEGGRGQRAPERDRDPRVRGDVGGTRGPRRLDAPRGVRPGGAARRPGGRVARPPSLIACGTLGSPHAPPPSARAVAPRPSAPPAAVRAPPPDHMRKVTLYLARDCSLCDRAREQVLAVRADVPFDLEEVDIT